MAKDPAFLFYSKDFYEGTRLMLPNERACYIDLIIYQHQNGPIPLDLDRVLMYCSGVDKATLEATLEAKFKATPEGYVNLKLQAVITERAEYKGKQSENGLVGQFFKQAKKALKANELKDLRDFVYGEYTKEKLIEELRKPEATHEATLEALLKHLEDANEDADVNKEIVKDVISYLNIVTGKKFKPTSSSSKVGINARVNDGYKLEDFKSVIDKKSAAWLEDERMNAYLRPETLFSPKFEGYLNETTNAPQKVTGASVIKGLNL